MQDFRVRIFGLVQKFCVYLQVSLLFLCSAFFLMSRDINRADLVVLLCAIACACSAAFDTDFKIRSRKKSGLVRLFGCSVKGTEWSVVCAEFAAKLLLQALCDVRRKLHTWSWHRLYACAKACQGIYERVDR